MRVFVTGSSGLIGSALVPSLENAGYSVTRLVRRAPVVGESERQWNPYAAPLDPALLDGADAVVNLSGENIAGRWTAERRERLWNSRVVLTRNLCEAIAAAPKRPEVFISASGSAIYGEGEDRELTEDSPRGQGYMADIVAEWENATRPAAEAGVRVVNLRIGVVLTRAGGALKAMLPAFRWGLGAALAPGMQYGGYISLEDLVGVIRHAIATPELRGPVNVVTPQPATQREFARTLGRLLHRPAFFTLPPFVLRVMFSPEMAQAAVWSQRMVPAKLLASGFRFRHDTVESALRHALGLSAEGGSSS